MNADQIAVVRRFNRSYTQRIGALDESFLGTGLPLGSARLLYEIGADPTTTYALRARLGLDSGYLSRLLRRLGTDGLITLRPDPQDRRRRRVDLTAAGRRAWRELEDRSQARARLLIDPLSGRQRARLAEALATADLLVRAATVELEPVSVDAPIARIALGHYFAELQRRFPDGFDAEVEAAKDATGLQPPDGLFVVATSDGEPVACGGVHALDDQVGEVKRMWVDPGWRGAGLGSRLLRHLESRAVDRGHQRLRLDTHDSLTEAVAMYRRSGYRDIEPYSDNPYARFWFEKRLH
jgi:DNA-binding MarR family transcriptional regulator